MKHRVPVLIGVATVSVALAGCTGLVGDVGEPVSEDRDISAATSVRLRTSGTVTLAVGSEPTLTITAGDAVIDQLTSEVRDGVLTLDAEGTRVGGLGTITYVLTLPEVDALTIDGSGSVTADLTPADALTVALNGSGDLVARGVDAASVIARIAGSGAVDLTGTALREEVTVTGSGDFRGSNLRAADAAVVVDGSGHAAVHATGTLDAAVSGSGSITHAGGATVRSNVAGSGSIDEG